MLYMPQLDIYILPVSLSILFIFFTVYIFYLKWFLPTLVLPNKLYVKGLIEIKKNHFGKNLDYHVKSYKFHDLLTNSTTFVWNVVKKECVLEKNKLEKQELSSAKFFITRLSVLKNFHNKYLSVYYKIKR